MSNSNKFRIFHADFEQCRSPRSASTCLGDSLARYLLRREAREELGLAAPKLPDEPGQLLGLYRSESVDSKARHVIAPGFALPLDWRKGESDSPFLPKELLEMAEMIRKTSEIDGFELHLGRELSGYDLSALSLPSQSLAAPLMAALKVAHSGGRPQGNVFSTGEWTDRGMVKIEGLKEKMSAMKDLFSARELKLFVPFENELEARALGTALEISIGTYPAGERRWKETLGAHLRELFVPPTVSIEGLEAACDYANLDFLALSADDRRAYYLSELLNPLSQKLIEGISESPRIEKLILGVSFSYEICLLLLRTLRPREALLLYTDETEKYHEKISAGVEGTAIEKRKIGSSDEQRTVDELAAWLSDASFPEARAVEITGGSKVVTAILIAAGQRAQARICYLKHETRGTLPLFGKERLEELDWLKAQKGSRT